MHSCASALDANCLYIEAYKRNIKVWSVLYASLLFLAAKCCIRRTISCCWPPIPSFYFLMFFVFSFVYSPLYSFHFLFFTFLLTFNSFHRSSKCICSYGMHDIFTDYIQMTQCTFRAYSGCTQHRAYNDLKYLLHIVGNVEPKMSFQLKSKAKLRSAMLFFLLLLT